jgi:site-specific recombinase XerC
MSKRAVCRSCKKERYIYRADGRCKVCAYSMGRCLKCHSFRKLYVDSLCYCCYQDRQVGKEIQKTEENFSPKLEYNAYLFKLYLLYIRRYRCSYYHKYQAEKLAQVLTQDSLSTITTWNDIYRLSRKYKLFHDNGRENGCAFKKIGYMLQELGILSSKNEDYQYALEQMLNRFKEPLHDTMKTYRDWMEKSGRTQVTIINNLRDIDIFNSWLTGLYPSLYILAINDAIVTNYLKNLSERHQHSYVQDAYYSMRRFFAWLLYRRKILFNPVPDLRLPVNLDRIVIADNGDIKKLIHFIKNENSPVEEAFIITLILFFGLTTDYLLHATVDFPNNKTIINLKRRPISYGLHYYNREQTFILPDSPKWLKKLSLKFKDYWQKRYSQTTKTYPAKRLILTHNGHYDRPVSKNTLVKRVYSATFKATGKKIPPKVLRQTCGHLYAKNGDASILSTLGWSPQFSFDYTWLPKQIFSDSKK